MEDAKTKSVQLISLRRGCQAVLGLCQMISHLDSQEVAEGCLGGDPRTEPTDTSLLLRGCLGDPGR